MAAPSPGLRRTRIFYNLTLGLAMLIGRFLMIVPMLAIAGSLVKKKLVPARAARSRRPGRCSSPSRRRDLDRRRR